MGGYGSGSWQSGKPRIEGRAEFDSDAMAIAWEARRAGQYVFVPLSDGSLLALGDTWHGVDHEGREARSMEIITTTGGCEQRVVRMLVAKPCPRGGVRWWWLCPGCYVLRKAVYLRKGYTLCKCRVCQDLTYTSSQMNRRANRWWCGLVGRELGYESFYALNWEFFAEARLERRIARGKLRGFFEAMLAQSGEKCAKLDELTPVK